MQSKATRFSASERLSLLALLLLAALVAGPVAQTTIGVFTRIRLGSACVLRTGTGSPESVVVGNVCDLFLRTDGSTSATAYLKESGASDTGWRALTSGTAGYYVRKTANESVTSSAVLQADDALLFAINANEVWEVTFGIFYGSTSTTPDLRLNVSVPSLGTYKMSAVGLACAATATTGDYDSYAATSGDFCIGTFTTGTQYVEFKGIVVNGSNNGNVTLNWAQWISNGAATTIASSSWLRAARLQ